MKRKTYVALLALAASISLAGLETVYADESTQELAFAQCEEYINVRSEASTDSSVVAQIFNNGSAQIIEKDGDWYKIQSGNASGYVKAEYFVTGEEADAVASKVAYNVAVVYPEELNVRTSPDESANVLDIAKKSEELEVVASEGDWMKVALTSETYGYVNANYVEAKTYYPTALTLEEIKQREAEAAAAGNASDTETPETDYTEDTGSSDHTETDPSPDGGSGTETEAPAGETQGSTEGNYETEAPAEETQEDTEYYETEAPVEETQEDTEYYETEAPVEETQEDTEYYETEAPVEETQEDTEYYETEAPIEETEAPVEETEAPVEETEAPSDSSSTGQSVADYAVQFVGNPYVWGGTSLTNGADCSGFTQSVFANFGIGLSRTAAEQAGGGTSVAISDIQPGDLLFYSDGGGISHVAIYIGGGQIVHASNAQTGITTSSYNYSTPVSASRYW
ncbi:MAG: NlpC/P60 family protein [Lachnospiraceae bacterium]|nr:NlpC/P60 family protein [Lachnospiraceae bacterium]